MQAIWIASELCNRGSLRMVLNDRTVELTWLKKLSLCLDVADGMLYLHTRHPPIIHRDLKSHNIFIIETSSGKVIESNIRLHIKCCLNNRQFYGQDW